MFFGFSQWVINQIVQDVPEDCAICEFVCRRQQCSESDRMACWRLALQRRLAASSQQPETV